MHWLGSVGPWILMGLGGLAHLICLAGLVVAFRSPRRVTSLRFSLAGLATVLALGLVAWWFYEMGLTLSDEGYEMARTATRGEVKLRGVSYAQESLTLCLYLAMLPLLGSVGLLIRGLMMDPDPANDAPGGAGRPVLAATCLVSGAGLLAAALLSHLNVGPFIFSMLFWVT